MLTLIKTLIPRKRKVLLIYRSGDTKIVNAIKSDSGWIANWWGMDDTWSILLPDGNTAGHSLVKKWLPHSGWVGNEFDKFTEPVAKNNLLEDN